MAGEVLVAILFGALIFGLPIWMLISAVIYLSNSQGSIRQRLSTGPSRALAAALLATTFYVALPFLSPFMFHTAEAVGFLVGAIAVIYIARGLTPGWAFLAVTAALITFTWTAGFSTYAAHEWGWQGLDIRARSMSGFDMGDGGALFFELIFATIVAPLGGFVVAVFVNGIRSKERTPSEDPAAKLL